MTSSDESGQHLRPGRSWHTRSQPYSQEDTPLAEAAIVKDLEDEPDNDLDDPAIHSRLSASSSRVSMVGSYRRPSFMPAGLRATSVIGRERSNRDPTETERHEARLEEQSLLKDNKILPPPRPQQGRRSKSYGGTRSHESSSANIAGGNGNIPNEPDDHFGDGLNSSREELSATEPLLGTGNSPNQDSDGPRALDKIWEEAVMAGKIRTTWRRETKVLTRYSAPLILTFLLQYSLTGASIFTVGHLGKIELGAVSLASMTANITGYAVYQGLATSLDTLCAQAYGSGRKTLVGLQTQRMVYFLFCVTLPIGLVWVSAKFILLRIVPEKEVAELAGLYLRIILFGAPGYACFESGKRYLQAQGLFSASLYCLLICAPLNAFMNWLFVWRFKWGFKGAPIAVTVTDNLLPIWLFLYVRFVAGSNCWPGFTKRAFRNWGPMIRLALPGLLMVEAESLAFEILTLASSYFGTSHLAAQSVLATITTFTWQIPFPISIAASTRIANFIGATLTDPARLSAKVSLTASAAVGIFNVILLSSLRRFLPYLFTNDEGVISLVADVLPLCAAFQLFDALAASCNGIMRGIGRQNVGGWVQLLCYYGVAMPVSMGTAFGLHWDLYGLWSGVALALGLVVMVEGVFLYNANWEKSVEDAKRRNVAF